MSTMDSSQDVELESENSHTSSPRPLRKNITIKLKSDKGPSSSKGRSRKSKSAKKEDQEPHSTEDEVLDTPIFKTMEPGEPLHHNKKLRWDHKVNLIGEKVVDPLIHCCEKCSLPILIYGRMIQCKHVFCFTCAKKTEKTCPRCGDPVQRIEQSALGTVFLCTYGTSKHGTDGCRRTYLSQRDLNAHIGHRHLKAEMHEQSSKGQTSSHRSSVPAVAQPKTAAPQLQSQTSQSSHQALLEKFNAVVRQATAALPQRQDENYQQNQLSHLQHSTAVSSAHQPMSHLLQHQVPHTYPASVMQPHPSLSASQSLGTQSIPTSSHDNFTSSIPVLGSRISTLISVPIQEDNDFNKQQQSYHTHQSGSSMPPINYPPPPNLSQYPVGSMAPNIHQPPPGVPPPMFSSQSVATRPLQNPQYTAPLTQQLRGPVQQLPPGPSGPPHAPQRLGAPPTGPPPRFFEGQNPRGPWTGAPPTAPPRPRGPPQADYNYY